MSRDGASDVDVVLIDYDDVSNYNTENILPQSPEKIQEIRSWLQPTSYDAVGGEYRKHRASHVAGTGAWLTSSATYQEWLQSSSHGMLWIRGIPGSGKSVMSANLISELAKSNPSSPVLFFFFRQIIEANHEPRALLRDWLDQVLPYSPPLQLQLATYLKDRRSIGSISMDDMWTDLRMALARLPDKVFCVVDALDEMDQGHEIFFEALGTLSRWQPGKVKVLMTSRPVPRVEVPLRRVPCLHLRLEENMVDTDISTYVRHTLSNSSIPRSDWQVIADAVPGRANGLFLYARLAMDAFLEPGADINVVLSQLPADLNYLYTDLLKEHAQRSGVDPSIQRLILQSVTHATRPMRLLELAEMIKVLNPDGHTRDLKATKDLVRAACGPLLEILADETISVIHHSFTEYLKGTTRLADNDSGYPILRVGVTHEQLALSCLRYLCSGPLAAVGTGHELGDDESDNGESESEDFQTYYSGDDLVKLSLEHPFFEYAYRNWDHHVRSSEAAEHDQSDMNAELRAIFLGQKEIMHKWLHMRWPERYRCDVRGFTQLHVAAHLGLVSYTKELLKNMGADQHGANDVTPLWWAATKGHAAVIRVLIRAGADPDQDDRRHGLKPLHKAASKNHHEAVRVLLEAGVDPLTPKTREDPGRRCGNAPRSEGHTALMYACDNGHLETVEAFLPFLRDIDTVHSALGWSAEKSKAKVVARILQHPGVDVNAKVRGDTALYRACSAPDVATITALIRAGADPGIMCTNSGDEFAGIGGAYFSQGSQPRSNSFHRVCGLERGWRGRYIRALEPDDWQTIISLFSRAGVDIHQRDFLGRTALHGAIGSPVLTRLLLDAGADADAVDNSGSAPLHKIGNMDCMMLLVEQGNANIELTRDDGCTPLLCMLASSGSATDLILKFLEYGPNCNAVDGRGNGVLHILLGKGTSNTAVVKALLKAGADPNLKNREGQTSLHTLESVTKGNMELLDLLLEAGANINAVDGNGMTLFFRLASRSLRSYGCDKGSHDDLRWLIDRGASAFFRDSNGGICLHEVVKSDQAPSEFGNSGVSRFDFLVDQGLDIRAVDYRGNGLLHELALRKDNHRNYSAPKIVPMWRNLLSMGLDLEQKNYTGRTPLHILCATNTHLSRNWGPSGLTPIDLIISQAKNLDAADKDGITPLHIAVTNGEMYAKKLLDAGANPMAITREGLTPLHLASRCRESNVVGLLLEKLRRRGQETVDAFEDPSKLQGMGETEAVSRPVMGVNARAFGRDDHITPLYYACKSGRPEAVQLLLEAGADVRIGKIFQACAEFEDEAGLWNNPHRPDDDRGNGRATALKVNDTSRPVSDDNSTNQPSFESIRSESARLEEILDMLIKNGADISQLKGEGIRRGGCISAAVSRNRDYTGAALIDAWNRNRDKWEMDTCPEIMLHSRMKSSIQALGDPELIASVHDHELVGGFLARREYHLVLQLAHIGVKFLPRPEEDREGNLTVLVKGGFSSLVEKIGTPEADAGRVKGDWHAFGDKTRPGLWFASRDISGFKHKGCNPEPFLIVAVKQEIPNLEVVRLLVEKFHVDINEQWLMEKDKYGSSMPVLGGGALHFVARGAHWWHVHQALPYLLQAGADVNMKDGSGRTPLHEALQGHGPYRKDAARILITAGADVNAVDDKGSCPVSAQNDADIIRLLISHGARMAAEAIFTAIDAENPEAVQALLSGGVDANIRRGWPSGESSEERKKKGGVFDFLNLQRGVKFGEVLPLHYAGRSLYRYSTADEADNVIRIMQVLLDHGADPMAKFLREEDATSVSGGDTPTINVPKGYEEHTVLHDLLWHKAPVDNILDLPGLDVNHRDAKGRTLLHVASRGSPDRLIGSWGNEKERNEPENSEGVTLFERLMFLGADLEARDNFGRNVLHYIISSGWGGGSTSFERSFVYTLNKAPHLKDQEDGIGRTPMYYAAVRACQGRHDGVPQLLLSAGASPFSTDNNGDNMLHKLAREIDSEKPRALFVDLARRGVDVNARNAQGQTPVFAFRQNSQHLSNFASAKGATTVEANSLRAMLEELGVDLFARDNEGRGLLHFAAEGSVQWFKALLEAGLDPMLEDCGQKTALDIAAARGNHSILALFEKKG